MDDGGARRVWSGVEARSDRRLSGWGYVSAALAVCDRVGGMASLVCEFKDDFMDMDMEVPERQVSQVDPR